MPKLFTVLMREEAPKIVCSHCNAQVGEHCKKENGSIASYPHAPRFNAAASVVNERMRGRGLFMKGVH